MPLFLFRFSRNDARTQDKVNNSAKKNFLHVKASNMLITITRAQFIVSMHGPSRRAFSFLHSFFLPPFLLSFGWHFLFLGSSQLFFMHPPPPLPPFAAAHLFFMCICYYTCYYICYYICYIYAIYMYACLIIYLI